MLQLFWLTSFGDSQVFNILIFGCYCKYVTLSLLSLLCAKEALVLQLVQMRVSSLPVSICQFAGSMCHISIVLFSSLVLQYRFVQQGNFQLHNNGILDRVTVLCSGPDCQSCIWSEKDPLWDSSIPIGTEEQSAILSFRNFSYTFKHNWILTIRCRPSQD